MIIKDVLSIGRNLAEYKKMFSLDDENLKSNILDVGAGPASFNMEMKANGHNTVVSVDPIYGLTVSELTECVEQASSIIRNHVSARKQTFNWSQETHPTIDSLVDSRQTTMKAFLSDFKEDNTSYLVGTTLSLPFPNKHFSLTLSSHFLVLYSEQLGKEFHVDAIRELCRVSREIRIYPLLNMAGEMPSAVIAAMREEVSKMNMQSEIVAVGYHFFKGADRMLRIF